MIRRTAGLLVLLAAVGGCGDGSPDVPEFEGTWAGILQGVTIQMTVSENDQLITGSGTLSDGTESVAFSVSGSHPHPALSFTLSAAGHPDSNFSGKFRTDDVVRGVFSGGGFPSDSVALIRE